MKRVTSDYKEIGIMKILKKWFWKKYPDFGNTNWFKKIWL